MLKKYFFIILLLFINTSFAASNKISLDLNDANLPDALRMLGKVLGKNIVVNPRVKGTITLHFSKMSPEEILNTLLISHDLTKRSLGHAWLIEPHTLFIHQREEQLKLQEIDEKVDPITTRVWQIHYAKAEELARILQDSTNSLLSKRGHVRVDMRTNSLCVQDTEKYLHDIYRLVHQLDIPVKQVLIEARLASIDIDFERQLGIRFESRSGSNDDKEHEGALLSGYSLAIAKLADGSLLDVKLSALENEGHGELISSPSLFTANQQTAYIESGEEIPYQETSRNGATSITFKKAVLSLKVTPQIMPDHTVLLQLQVNQDKPSSHTVLGVPAINTRQISTNVLVKNGRTIVLGGIYEENNEEGSQRIPFLSKIPLLGLIFQQKNRKEGKRELLIFVTPRIVL